MSMHEVKLTLIIRDLSDLAPLVAELTTNERTAYVRVDQVQELIPMVAEPQTGGET